MTTIHFNLRPSDHGVGEGTVRRSDSAISFQRFATDIINQLNELGRTRSAETYRATLASFMHFRRRHDVPIDAIDADMLMRYQAFLRRRRLTPNTISFYMRILRAIYNRAVDRGLVLQQHPFRHVYTGIEKTRKRALPIAYIRRINRLDLSDHPHLAFARDLFLFSFYTRGMSFIDIAFLRPSNIQGGYLIYRRHKTGQQLCVRWERCMQDIVDRYRPLCADGESAYLLPILSSADNPRHDYLVVQHRTNNHLKILSQLIHSPHPLTMYVARHSWASIAHSQRVPIAVISEAMGHDSEATTQIYLTSLSTATIDRANRRIINSL